MHLLNNLFLKKFRKITKKSNLIILIFFKNFKLKKKFGWQQIKVKKLIGCQGPFPREKLLARQSGHINVPQWGTQSRPSDQQQLRLFSIIFSILIHLKIKRHLATKFSKNVKKFKKKWNEIGKIEKNVSTWLEFITRTSVGFDKKKKKVNSPLSSWHESPPFGLFIARTQEKKK